MDLNSEDLLKFLRFREEDVLFSEEGLEIEQIYKALSGYRHRRVISLDEQELASQSSEGKSPAVHALSEEKTPEQQKRKYSPLAAFNLQDSLFKMFPIEEEEEDIE